MSYQSFQDNTGNSKSDEKFNAIHLGDLSGKAVLDLGCNEGYFCKKSVEAGATTVIGIDQSQKFINAAKNRFPDIDFRCQSWDVLPEGKFDVIIFLSAIHYETNQAALLKRLHNALNPGGRLILECGVVDGYESKWVRVHRKVGSVLYPTESLLKKSLLKDFAVRSFGDSVMQVGDPVKRFVFHATPKEKSLVFVSGKSHAGKSSLCENLESEADVFSLDHHLIDLAKYEQTELAKFIKLDFSRFQLANIYMKIERSPYINEYTHSILESLPDNDLVFIEGWALTQNNIRENLIKVAKSLHYRVWGMARL